MAGQKGYGAIIADHIAAIVARRRIEHVLHFTRLENLPHILRHGLRSRADLADADFSVHPSDADRLDERDDAISVSISCYAPAMFEAKRYRAGNRPWVVLILRPELLWRNHCLFFSQGAATRATKNGHSRRYGGYALEKLFDDFPLPANPGSSFRAEFGLPPSWPTYSDAEVQVMNPIDPGYIAGTWIERPDEEVFVRATFHGAGRMDCETIVQPFVPRLSRKPYYWG